MDAATPTFSSPAVFKRAGVGEIAVLLGVAWLVPFAVHLVPWSGDRPLGVYLLPMFWATFVAVYFYGGRIGLLVGLFAPAVNLLVTGLPAWQMASVMGVELAVFALVTGWAVRHRWQWVLLAPLGYMVARMASLAVQAATADDIGAPGAAWVNSLIRGFAGLVVLAAVNAALVWFYPKRDGEEP